MCLSGGKKCSFFGKFDFLQHPFWDSPFCVITDELTNKSLNCANFQSSGIAKIISHLDPNKVHGHDMQSTRMFKLPKFNLQTPVNNI